MLLWLLNEAQAVWFRIADSGGRAAFDKVAFRGSLAAGLGLLFSLLLGTWFIRWFARRLREPIKSDSAHLRLLHRSKRDTPTMGGLFVMAAICCALLICADPDNRLIQAALVVAFGLAGVGAIDDLVKIRRSSNGIPPLAKLVAQAGIALIAAALVYRHHVAVPGGLQCNLPWVGISFSLGAWFLPLAVTVIVGASNAVNLTDGLDGLAGGCLVLAVGGMAAGAYCTSKVQWAASMNMPYLPDCAEVLVLAGAVLGAVLGFLWFNRHPARVFLGDTGSLPLGGLLGLIAVATRQEFLLVVVGGVFVAEAASVILQVGYYKWRRRRIFLCAPLHHHFQFLGWAEGRIVVRFWMAAALCAVLGLACLKAG
jgi:phospho-N-acetylmuramoyl-pentapeptide-transferase